MRISILLILLSFSCFAQKVEWLNNIDSAKIESKAKSKLILLKFSGSDWCANCQYLDRMFFNSEIFKKFAPNHLVLLEADFPMRKGNKLSKDQQIHNENLAEKFNEKGSFPLVIMLNEEGIMLGAITPSGKDIKGNIEKIKSFISK